MPREELIYHNTPNEKTEILRKILCRDNHTLEDLNTVIELTSKETVNYAINYNIEDEELGQISDNECLIILHAIQRMKIYKKYNDYSFTIFILVAKFHIPYYDRHDIDLTSMCEFTRTTLEYISKDDLLKVTDFDSAKLSMKILYEICSNSQGESTFESTCGPLYNKLNSIIEIMCEKQERISQLEKRVADLENQIKYAPGGEGAVQAKSHFESLAPNQKNN